MEASGAITLMNPAEEIVVPARTPLARTTTATTSTQANNKNHYYRNYFFLSLIKGTHITDI